MQKTGTQKAFVGKLPARAARLLDDDCAIHIRVVLAVLAVGAGLGEGKADCLPFLDVLVNLHAVLRVRHVVLDVTVATVAGLFTIEWFEILKVVQARHALH